MSISDQVTMFYNASPIIFERANTLRNKMTTAETKLWEYLRGRRILNLRFRAQHPLNKFIADFYCHSLKLIIEVDGDIHKSKEQREYDIGREAEIDGLGIKVIRFKNDEIENSINLVIDKNKKECALRSQELESPL